ncbi:TapY2 family type IVa secretion system protein [Shewanella sp.]|uniref:TapY2 family type IVa secretion system protein n=1 Tax=Shewanella sp. TaxID=50422 RepID=UPI00345C98DC
MKPLIILLLAVFSSSLVFASEKQDYKCYVNSTDGDKIVFYRWQVKEYKLKVDSLPGRINVSKDNKKFYIRNVHECVLINETFTLGRAQKLDLTRLY